MSKATNAKAMAAAFAKMGSVARATNAELVAAKAELLALGDTAGATALACEQARRASALTALRAALPE